MRPTFNTPVKAERARKRKQVGALALLAALVAGPATAIETDFSVFGTLGYTRSNSDLVYLRGIDRNGTLAQDTRLGLQADVRLSPQWSATVQLRAAPKADAESGYDITPAWAFLAWRPDNDWLVRAGKFRVPFYLYSQVLDLGVAHPFARLPQEIYTVSPVNDFKGLYLTRTMNLDSGELSLDVVAGQANPVVRFWYRDGVPPQVPAGASYRKVDIDILMLAASHSTPDLTLRATGFWSKARTGGQLPVRLPFVQLAPGIGFFVVDPRLGPVETTDIIHNVGASFGLDWRPAPGWRMAAEYFDYRQKDTELGSNIQSSYVALARQMGAWTPYAYAAQVRTRDPQASLYRQLTQPTLPSGAFPGAGQLNAGQRVLAESALYMTHQRTFALGAAWTPAPHSVVKFEWARTRIATASRLVDVAPGQTSAGQRINVFSVNYSFSF